MKLQKQKNCRKAWLKHYVLNVTRDDFFKDLPKIMEAMDQPSIDGINVWYALKQLLIKIKSGFFRAWWR